MSVLHLNVLDLLGKQVSFTCPHPTGQLVKKGSVTSVVVSLERPPEILLDDSGVFHLLTEITDLQLA